MPSLKQLYDRLRGGKKADTSIEIDDLDYDCDQIIEELLKEAGKEK